MLRVGKSCLSGAERSLRVPEGFGERVGGFPGGAGQEPLSSPAPVCTRGEKLPVRPELGTERALA